MNDKTIAIPQEVYEKLRAEQRAGETDGETIDRLLESRPLAAFWGAWNEGTAEAARCAIAESRHPPNQPPSDE